jgi:uncharacterized membrane protein
MASYGSPRANNVEPRWPVLLTVLAVLFLQGLLPGRISIFPRLAAYIAVIAVMLPILAVQFFKKKERWLRIEHVVTLAFCVVAGLSTQVNLYNLVTAITVRQTGITGVQLLSSGISVWITNILIFGLLYWQVDHGGPQPRAVENRGDSQGSKPDWLFPQENAADHAAPGWRPEFVDYLFLAFSTATAFSTTDVLPFSPRAKMLMMLESLISLVVIVIVGARSINILGH